MYQQTDGGIILVCAIISEPNKDNLSSSIKFRLCTKVPDYNDFHHLSEELPVHLSVKKSWQYSHDVEAGEKSCHCIRNSSWLTEVSVYR